MVLAKAMLSATLLASSLTGNPMLPPMNPTYAEIEPRLSGNLTSGWLTSTDGLSQAKINFTHELGTNRIVYINSIASFRVTDGKNVNRYWIAGYSTSGNTATINIGYTLYGYGSTFLGTFYLVV